MNAHFFKQRNSLFSECLWPCLAPKWQSDFRLVHFRKFYSFRVRSMCLCIPIDIWCWLGWCSIASPPLGPPMAALQGRSGDRRTSQLVVYAGIWLLVYYAYECICMMKLKVIHDVKWADIAADTQSRAGVANSSSGWSLCMWLISHSYQSIHLRFVSIVQSDGFYIKFDLIYLNFSNYPAVQGAGGQQACERAKCCSWVQYMMIYRRYIPHILIGSSLYLIYL